MRGKDLKMEEEYEATHAPESLKRARKAQK
jgi:hypothetical protein